MAARWLALWLCLLAGLTAQTLLDLRLAGEELDRQTRALALAEAGLLRTMIALSLPEGEAPDEFSARYLVLAFLSERRDLRAAAVYGAEGLLEAQERLADGSLAPLARVPLEESGLSASLPLPGGGRVWVALPPGPQAERRAAFGRAACRHLACTAAGTGAVLFLLLLLSERRSRKKES